MKRLIGVAAMLTLAACSSTSPTSAGSHATSAPTASAVRTAVPPAPKATTTPATAATTTLVESEGAPPALATVGDTVEVQSRNGSASLTLNSAKRMKADQFGSAPDNGTFLVIDVTFTGIQGSVEVNPGFFRAQTEDGYTYNASFGGVDPQLDSQPVVAPGKTSGKVTIDAPTGPILVDFATPLGDPLATFQIP